MRTLQKKLYNMKISIIPYDDHHQNNVLFEKNILFKSFKNFANDKIEIMTFDRLPNPDVLIIYNKYYFPVRRLISLLRFRQLPTIIYFQSETSMILPINNFAFLKSITKLGVNLFTFESKLMSFPNTFKINISNAKKGIHPKSNNKQRKELVMIQSNKKSRHRLELYSLRTKIIAFLGNRRDIGFDLFGYGFSSDTPNYIGNTPDKYQTLCEYKFSFAFENSRGFEGYISEKIFDCFYTLTIPIYRVETSTRINSFPIPLNTFIDIESYESFDSLIEDLKSITQVEYEKYIHNIKEFINSNEYVKFTSDYNAKFFLTKTLELNNVNNAMTKFLFLHLLFVSTIHNLLMLGLKISKKIINIITNFNSDS
jgi:hypothetical protein